MGSVTPNLMYIQRVFLLLSPRILNTMSEIHRIRNNITHLFTYVYLLHVFFKISNLLNPLNNSYHCDEISKMSVRLYIVYIKSEIHINFDRVCVYCIYLLSHNIVFYCCLLTSETIDTASNGGFEQKVNWIDQERSETS